MSLRVNFTDVSDRGPAKPNGWYHVKVSDGETKVVQNGVNKGKEYMNIELTVQKDEYAGQKFFVGLHPLIEKALPIVKSFLRATDRYSDAELDSELEWDSWEEFYHRIDGAELLIRNKQREYDSDMVDNVAGFKKLEGNESNTGAVVPGSSLLP